MTETVTVNYTYHDQEATMETSPLVESLIEAHNEKRKRSAVELDVANRAPGLFSEAFVNRAVRQFQRAQANLRYWQAQR